MFPEFELRERICDGAAAVTAGIAYSYILKIGEDVMTWKMFLKPVVFSALALATANTLLGQIDESQPTPLRPAAPIAFKVPATYVTEVRFISFPVDEDSNALPEELLQTLSQLEPDQVQIVGGVETPDQTWNQEIPESAPTSLSLTLEPEQVESLMKAVADSKQCNVLSAPKLSLVEGQHGQVNDVITRTFVTGVDVVTKEGAIESKGYLPKTKNFFEGSRLSLCVKPQGEDKLKVSSRVTVSKIAKVTEVPIGTKPDVTLQFPVWDTKTQDFEHSLEEGQSALVTLGVRQREVRVQQGSPIPGMRKLFKKSMVVSEPEYLAMVITLRSLKPE